MQLNGQLALVTGSAKRIGKHIAIALAKEKADVIIHYNTSRTEAEQTASACASLGVNSTAIHADLSDSDGTLALWHTACQHFNRPPTILINNASHYNRETFEQVTPDSFDTAIAVNLRAPLLLTQQMAQHLPPLNLNGCVINISDSRQTYTSRWSYGITSAARSGLLRSLTDSVPQQIRVNEIRLPPVLPPQDRPAAHATENSNSISLLPVETVTKAVLNFIRDDNANGQSLELTN